MSVKDRDPSGNELLRLIYQHLNENGYQKAAKELKLHVGQKAVPTQEASLQDIYSYWAKAPEHLRKRKLNQVNSVSPRKKPRLSDPASSSECSDQEDASKTQAKDSKAVGKSPGPAVLEKILQSSSDEDSDSDSSEEEPGKKAAPKSFIKSKANQVSGLTGKQVDAKAAPGKVSSLAPGRSTKPAPSQATATPKTAAVGKKKGQESSESDSSESSESEEEQPPAQATVMVPIANSLAGTPAKQVNKIHILGKASSPAPGKSPKPASNQVKASPKTVAAGKKESSESDSSGSSESEEEEEKPCAVKTPLKPALKIIAATPESHVKQRGSAAASKPAAFESDSDSDDSSEEEEETPKKPLQKASVVKATTPVSKTPLKTLAKGTPAKPGAAKPTPGKVSALAQPAKTTPSQAKVTPKAGIGKEEDESSDSSESEEEERTPVTPVVKLQQKPEATPKQLAVPTVSKTKACESESTEDSSDEDPAQTLQALVAKVLQQNKCSVNPSPLKPGTVTPAWSRNKTPVRPAETPAGEYSSESDSSDTDLEKCREPARTPTVKTPANTNQKKEKVTPAWKSQPQEEDSDSDSDSSEEEAATKPTLTVNPLAQKTSQKGAEKGALAVKAERKTKAKAAPRSPKPTGGRTKETAVGKTIQQLLSIADSESPEPSDSDAEDEEATTAIKITGGKTQKTTGGKKQKNTGGKRASGMTESEQSSSEERRKRPAGTAAAGTKKEKKKEKKSKLATKPSPISVKGEKREKKKKSMKDKKKKKFKNTPFRPARGFSLGTPRSAGNSPVLTQSQSAKVEVCFTSDKMDFRFGKI
ncbi:nucleolar protein dao-5-like isoform X2 [Acipenser ruthenus]|uniref:nucleolar protein dao-5-like isoform X2 n=1 Tax=Acipenser ruthenus TaxID=7906 RepID=UPI00274158A0|nr:nucleolar protein dao-5-like isoform X2 [Acipenser ruthenus]